jgi:hypothetical protein
MGSFSDSMPEASRAAVPHQSPANQYRALAEECERLAADVKTEKERDELLRKAKGYRVLAGGGADAQ